MVVDGIVVGGMVEAINVTLMEVVHGEIDGVNIISFFLSYLVVCLLSF
jgi:hypothetical protein